MKTIRIQNFGPIIDSGTLDISKITIFIGDQGSGKSTVAKLISVLSWIEKALVRGDFTDKEIAAEGRFKARCSYHDIQNYFKEGHTFIEYVGCAYKLTYQNRSFSAVSLNGSEDFMRPKIMCVPAERNFISAVSNYESLKGLAENIFTFSFQYTQALQNAKEAIDRPMGDVKVDYDKLNKIVSLIVSNYKIRMTEAASGFQSFTPLYITTKFLSEQLDSYTEDKVKETSVKEEMKLMRTLTSIASRTDLSDYFFLKPPRVSVI